MGWGGWLMCDGWRDVTLGSLARIKHGWPFKSQYFSEPLPGTPIVINIGNFSYTGGFRFDSTTLKGYSGEFPKEYELGAGEIVIVMTCQTQGGEILGVPGRIPADGRRYLHNQRLGRVVVHDRSLVDPGFLYWLFLWDEFKRHLFATSSGTKILHTAPARIEAFEFALPPLAEQVEVARLIWALNDRIELNRRMNRTLESVARAIFRSWFVDFDPVVAKSGGRQPFGMSADVAALFPEEKVSGERGEVPLGWPFRPLAEVTTKIGSGATPRGGSAVYVPQGTSFIRSQNVLDHEFEWSGLARITDEAAQELRGVTVQEGDILLNITGDSILRTCVVDSAALPARVSQHVAIIRPSPGLPSRYLHLRMVDDEMKDFLIGFDAGGTRPAVTKAQLETVPILVPPDALLGRFDELTNPLFRRIDSNRRESRTLATLRDTLLPKLMSGELRVRYAEKLVGKHV
jgi:type I restriction enzyme S subunit